MANAQAREEEIFRNHYSKLQATLIDVDSLLPHFVEHNIITIGHLDEMASLTALAKVSKLLSHISGPLKAGNTKSFHIMLSIMEIHGTQATRDLATLIKDSLGASSRSTSGQSTSENDDKVSEMGSQQRKDYSPVLTPDPLSVHFSNFVTTVEEYLEKCIDKLEACKRICCNLTIGGDSDALLFNNEQLSKINECSSFRDLFTLLRQHWNWKEYSILESIIVKSESDDAMFALQRFKQLVMFTSPSPSYCEIPLSSPVCKIDMDDEKERKCDNCTEDDPAVAYCPDCSIFLCLVCKEYHKRDKRSRSHDVVPFSEGRTRSKSKTFVCTEHDYELKHYCETCEELVCLYCTLKTHSTHSHDTIKKMANKHRRHLKEVTTPLEKMIRDISEAQNNIENMKRSISEQGEEVEKKIDQHYQELIEQLMQQKEKMKQQAHDIVSQKVKAVTTQLEEMGLIHEELCSIEKLNNTLQEGPDQDALCSKKYILESMERLTSRYRKLSTHPIESATIEFVSAKEDIPQHGQVYAYVNPASCEVLNFPKYTYKGVKVDFTIITKYSNGRRYPKGGSQVSVEVESAGEITTINVKDNNDGSYTASFVAHHFGKIDISATIGGLHINKSPFSVLVIKNYPSIDKPNRIVDIDGKMGVPWGVAFGRYGIWAVADYSCHCVYIFDGQDRMVRKFGAQGTNIGHFQKPGGLAFDSENNLYVADRYNHRVQKFDSNGNYLLSFGSQRSGEGQLGCPVGIVIHSDKVYVTEQDNNRISVFKTNGSFCVAIGQGYLSNPFDVAVNINGQLLVADCVHNCIFTFTLDGHYEGKFGPRGSGRGQLNNPRSITTDSNGFIFVAEFGNHRVSIFDKDGNFMHCFGSRGSAYGQFQSPSGVALSSNGNVYVSDGYGKRIQVFTAY